MSEDKDKTAIAIEKLAGELAETNALLLQVIEKLSYPLVTVVHYPFMPTTVPGIQPNVPVLGWPLPCPAISQTTGGEPPIQLSRPR